MTRVTLTCKSDTCEREEGGQNDGKYPFLVLGREGGEGEGQAHQYLKLDI